MRIEFARIRTGKVITMVETGEFGDVNREFLNGVGIRARVIDDRTVEVDLSDFAKEKIRAFHGRHVRRPKRVSLGLDGAGCTQVNSYWMLIVARQSSESLLKRIGHKGKDRFNRRLLYVI